MDRRRRHRENAGTGRRGSPGCRRSRSRQSAPVDEHIENFAALKAAVNVVAEVDDDTVEVGRRRCRVLGDGLIEPLQQVGASVDIADGVDPHAIRNPRRRGSGTVRAAPH